MLPKEVGRDFKVLRDNDIRSSRTRSPTAQMFTQPLSDTCISKIVQYQKNNSGNESHHMTTRQNTLEPRTHETTSVHTGQQQWTIAQYRTQQQLLHYFKCLPSFTELEFSAGFTWRNFFFQSRNFNDNIGEGFWR